MGSIPGTSYLISAEAIPTAVGVECSSLGEFLTFVDKNRLSTATHTYMPTYIHKEIHIINNPKKFSFGSLLRV